MKRATKFQLRKARLDVYRFIRNFKRSNDGVSPTTYEIAESLGLSRFTVGLHINELIRLGVITVISDGASRGIMMTGGYYVGEDDSQKLIEIAKLELKIMEESTPE